MPQYIDCTSWSKIQTFCCIDCQSFIVCHQPQCTNCASGSDNHPACQLPQTVLALMYVYHVYVFAGFVFIDIGIILLTFVI